MLEQKLTNNKLLAQKIYKIMKQKRINQVSKISGGIYFINNTAPIIVGPDWISLELPFFEVVSPNLYFNLENNKLKYIKGKSKLECNISWNMSIKSESEFKIRIKNKEFLENASIMKVIGSNFKDKILLNESFILEIYSNLEQEILISSAFIIVSEL